MFCYQRCMPKRMIKVMIARAFMFQSRKGNHNSYLKQSFLNDFRNFRISRWPVGNMPWCQFPSVSKQGDPINRSALVSSPRETCGKCEVSMWFPLCLHKETRDFHVVSLMFTLGNPGFLVVLLMFPLLKPGFPCSFPLSTIWGNN